MSELYQSSHLHNEASVHINTACLLDIYDAYLRFFNKNLILRFDPHRGPGSPESRVKIHSHRGTNFATLCRIWLVFWYDGVGM